MRRIFNFAIRNLGIITIVFTAIYCFAHTFDPPRLNWGDSGSDYNVMEAGKNFDADGFLKLKLTPHLFESKFINETNKRFIYTHYPQLPDLANGLLRRVFNLTNISEFRVFSLLLSILSLFFIYKLISKYWNPAIAQLSSALWVINPLWIQHADYLHHYPYVAFLGAGSIYFLTKYIETKRSYFKYQSAITLFLAYLASYDYWFFIPITVCFILLYQREHLNKGEAIRLCSTLMFALFAALVFKFGTNAWALGGIKQFCDDLHFQFIERATDTIVRTSYMSGMKATLAGRIDHYFTYSLPITFVFNLLLLLPKFKRSVSFHYANPIYLLVAAIPFLYIFKELWVAQHYPMLLILPFYAISTGTISYHLYKSGPLITKIIAVCLFVMCAGNSLHQNMAFEKAFFEPHAITSLNQSLSTLSKPNEKILINHVFDSLYRYYFSRDTVPMILTPRGNATLESVRYHAQLRPEGSIFVEHLNVQRELFDKAYYYIFSKDQKWQWWGSPSKYRDDIDAYIGDHNSQLMNAVRSRGTLLVETGSYRIWRIK